MDYLFSTWTQYARSTAEGGFLTALSAVCLLHYFVQLHRLGRERREHLQAKHAINGLEHQLKSTQNECSVALVESELLREILSGGSPEVLVQMILQHLVPDPEQGWAAFIELHPEPRITASRGLIDSAARGIDIRDEFIQPAWTGHPVTFHQPRLAKSPFLLNFSANDRCRSEQLHVLGIQSSERHLGLLVTTHLIPQRAPIEQQIELARRMAACLAQHLEAWESQSVQVRELRNSTDRLTIRALFDQEFDNPLRMIQQFLRTVQLLIDADRGVLFFSTSIASWDIASQVTTGPVPIPELHDSWQHCEEHLVRLTHGWSERVLFDAFGLELLDLNQSFQAAVVIPVVVKTSNVGTLCFTRTSERPFTVEQQQLVLWAIELLADKLSTAIQQAEIKRMARLDAVTQIANRHTFDKELERELQIAYATSSELSVILFDLDRFKSVNDSFGHLAGDEALRLMGELLHSSLSHLRAGDRAFCARYGGEEFAVILPGVGPLGTARIAELIRSHVEQSQMLWQKQRLPITVSGGIATYPENGETVERLIAAADAALYQAKKSGRNKIGFPEPGRQSVEQTDANPRQLA